MEIILASASPRRVALLEQIGVVFRVEVSNIVETMPLSLSAAQITARLALAKAQDVASHHHEGLVIGADTVVVLADKVMGKPANDHEARQMLMALSGKCHQVMTAVAIVDATGQRPAWQGLEKTDVYFTPLSEADIADYLATGESRDKAGAYGIQGLGALLVQRIAGCYSTIVGLPLQQVAQGLKTMGVDLYRYGKYPLHH